MIQNLTKIFLKHQLVLSTVISSPEVSRSLCTEMGPGSGAMRCCFKKCPARSAAMNGGRERIFVGRKRLWGKTMG